MQDAESMQVAVAEESALGPWKTTGGSRAGALQGRACSQIVLSGLAAAQESRNVPEALHVVETAKETLKTSPETCNRPGSRTYQTPSAIVQEGGVRGMKIMKR